MSVYRTLKLKREFYDGILTGCKRVEARVCDDKTRQYQIGDVFEISCDGSLVLPSFKKTISKLNFYIDFEQMLKTEGDTNVIPANSDHPDRQAIDVYHIELAPYRFKERAEEEAQKHIYGVVAIHLV